MANVMLGENLEGVVVEDSQLEVARFSDNLESSPCSSKLVSTNGNR